MADLRDDHATAVAAFLMGTSMRIPTVQLRSAIPLAQLHLYRGSLAAASHATEIQHLCGRYGWEETAPVSFFSWRTRNCVRAVRRAEDIRRGFPLDRQLRIRGTSLPFALGAISPRGRGTRSRDCAAPSMTALTSVPCGLRLFRIELLCGRGPGFLLEGMRRVPRPLPARH